MSNVSKRETETVEHQLTCLSGYKSRQSLVIFVPDWYAVGLLFWQIIAGSDSGAGLTRSRTHMSVTCPVYASQRRADEQKCLLLTVQGIELHSSTSLELFVIPLSWILDASEGTSSST